MIGVEKDEDTLVRAADIAELAEKNERKQIETRHLN